jgi:hypothetical protein
MRVYPKLNLSKWKRSGGVKVNIKFYARNSKLNEYNKIVVQNYRTELRIFNSVMLHVMYDCNWLHVMLGWLFK